MGLNLVMERLGTDAGCPELGLPALGSFLWSPQAVTDLAGCQIANHDLLDAVRALAFTVEGSVRRPVDYKNLGSEELGSVYESLLELHPDLSVDAGTFALETAGGNERKTTGSYYTPACLIARLLDSALDPVLDEAARKPDPVAAILGLEGLRPGLRKRALPGRGRPPDRPAAGLGSHRRRGARPRGSPQGPPRRDRDVRLRRRHQPDGRRAVQGQPLDGRPGAGQAAVVPRRPRPARQQPARRDPRALRRGVPDEAFEPIEGDDRAACRDLRKKNRDERRGQGTMFDRWEAPAWERLGNLAPVLAKLAAIPDDTIDGVHAKEQRYAELVRSSPYESATLWADAWCAAFVIRKKSALTSRPGSS